MEDLLNDPLCFTAPDPESLNLTFAIYPASARTKDTDSLIGSAIAMIGHLKHGLGSKRESLTRNFTVPIQQKDKLAYIGSVTFYFLIVTPYPHLRTKHYDKQEINFGVDGEPTVIGHRGTTLVLTFCQLTGLRLGTGQNDPSRRQLQIGENTIEESRSLPYRLFPSDGLVVIPLCKESGRFLH